MKKSINFKIASFQEAFEKFLSYTDGSLKIQELSSFAELKENKVIKYRNKSMYWNGNHSHSDSEAELFYIENPTTFYVVKFHEYDSETNHTSTKMHIFVPNE